MTPAWDFAHKTACSVPALPKLALQWRNPAQELSARAPQGSVQVQGVQTVKHY